MSWYSLVHVRPLYLACALLPLRNESNIIDRHRRHGKESRHEKERPAVERNRVIHVSRIRIQRIQRLNKARDDRHKRQKDKDVIRHEQATGDRMPADARMHRAQQALDEDQVEDKEQQDAGSDEDLRGDDEADVREVGGPCHAQAQCHGAEEADVDQQDGEAEGRLGVPVMAEDGDMDCEADDVEEHEDGADGYVDGGCGRASWGCGGGWVGS